MSQCNLLVQTLFPDSPTEKTLTLLQERLGSAEEKAKQLSERLAKFGFKRESCLNDVYISKEISNNEEKNKLKCLENVSLENECGTIKRLCMIESLMESLRSGVQSLEMENSSTAAQLRKENFKMKENYAKEINALAQQLADHKKAKSLLEKQVKKITTEAKKSIETEKLLREKLVENKLELEAYQQKLTEVSKSISSERSLKLKLEKEQSSLLSKIKESESCIENEHINIQKLNARCESLTNDALLAREEFEKEYERRLRAESLLDMHEKELVSANHKLQELSMESTFLQQKSNDMESRISKMSSETDVLKTELRVFKEENGKLKGLLKLAAVDNQALVMQKTEALNKEQAKLEQVHTQQNKILDSAKKQLLQELEKHRQQTNTAEAKAASLQEQLMESETRREESDFKMSIMEQSHSVELSRLQQSLDSVEKIKSEQKLKIAQLETEMLNNNKIFNSKHFELLNNNTELKESVDELKAQVGKLAEENTRLAEKLSWTSMNEKSQKDIENQFNDILKQKNALAYEKGLLQSKADTLQAENNDLCTYKNDSAKYRKKYEEIQSNLDTIQISKQQMNERITQSLKQLQKERKELQRVQSKLNKAEKDVEILIVARDKALHEVEQLATHIQNCTKEHKNEKENLLSRLRENEEQRNNMSSTFKTLISTNENLQRELEAVQFKMGEKDAELTTLKTKRLDGESIVEELKAELDVLTNKLDTMSHNKHDELLKLKTTLKNEKENMAALQTCCNQLKADKNDLKMKLIELKNEIKQKDTVLKDYIDDRQRSSSLQAEEQKAAIQKIKNDHMKENNKLRQRANNFKSILDTKQAECSLAHEKLKAMSQHFTQVENDKGIYEEKNKRQASLLQSFMEQISELEQEIGLTANSQNETTLKLREKEVSLKKEKEKRREMEMKYKALLRKHAETEVLRKNNNWAMSKSSCEMKKTLEEEKIVTQDIIETYQRVMDENQRQVNDLSNELNNDFLNIRRRRTTTTGRS